jgi:(hydroxyamino)benzene mutase
MVPHRALLRAGFLLMLLALLSGTVIPLFTNPRLAVSAHVTGMMSGLLLVALGLAWGALRQSEARGRLVRALFLYGGYANWGVSLLGAAWGTKRLTPVAGAGYGAAPWQETVVQVGLLSLVLAMLLGTFLVVLALGPQQMGDGPSVTDKLRS